MSNEQAWYLHGILTPGGTLIGGLTDVTPATNTERLIAMANGHPEPLFTGVRSQKPDVVFTSTSVGAILTLINAGGSIFCLDLSAGNVDLLYVKGKPQGIRYALNTTNHLRIRAAKGFLYWRTIRAQHGQEATIECRLVPVYDGTNQPLVPTGSIALSGTPSVVQLFTLGPVKVNGSALPGVQEWSLAAGEQTEELSGDGEIWTTYAGLRHNQPAATIRLASQPWANYAPGGTALSALQLFLRRKDPDGGNEPNASGLHVLLAGTNGTIEPQDARGGANDPSTTTLLAQLRGASSSGAALAYTADTAIT